jgi:hypothetical protein
VSDPRGSSSSSVPLEHREAARALRARLETAWERWSVAADRLIAPFQAGSRTSEKHFARLARDWKAQLPKPGRLAVHARFKDGRLKIAETRLVPSSVRLPGWDADDDEPCLSLVLRQVRASLPERVFRVGDLDLAVFGEHSIAHRYERSASREDFDVAMDCFALGKHYPVIAAGKSEEFKIFGTSGGAWVGKVMVDPAGRVFLLVRTFAKIERPGGFSFADAVSKVTRDGEELRWSA